MTNPSKTYRSRFSAGILAAGFVMGLVVLPAAADETTQPLMPTSPLTAGELTVTKSCDTKTTKPGDELECTVVVANTGAADLLDVSVADTLPESLFFTAYKGQAYEFMIDSPLAAGDEKTLTYSVTVREEAAAGKYVNTATATAANHDPVAATATIEVSGDEPVVAAQPALTISKSVDPTTVKPGETAVFTLIVKNAGPGMAKNVMVNDVLADGLTYQDTSGQTRSWTLGDLEKGANDTITYTVVVGNDVANGAYENTAVVTADNHKAMKDTARLTVERAQVLGVSTDTENGGQVLAETGVAANDVVMFVGAVISLVISAWTLRRLLSQSLPQA